MKKKHVFTAITLFIVGTVYGAIFSSILRGVNVSVLSYCVQGLLIGTFTAFFYLGMTWGFGYIFKDEEMLALVRFKILLVEWNIWAIVAFMYILTSSITFQNKYPIARSYAWILIANLLFAVVIFAKANYDGKKLRKKQIV